jgi:hypothetical protein
MDVRLRFDMSRMEKLSQLYETNQRIKLEREIAASLISDPEVSKMLKFLAELDSLASEYQFKPLDIVRLLCPDLVIPESLTQATTGVGASCRSSGPRKTRGQQGKGSRSSPPKRYQNLHTGELIEVDRSTKKILRQWQAEYGADVVETWIV